MRYLLPPAALFLLFLLTSCYSARPYSEPVRQQTYGSTEEPPITESLFTDKDATISEENIRKILDGTYSLAQDLRVSIVKIEDVRKRNRYYWADEDYLKAQQAYLDLFTAYLDQSERVSRVSAIPDLLLSSNPTFTNIREAAVRSQSDVVVIYTITGDVYSNYRLFNKNEIKAFATTQLVVLDVRTGLIPFTTIVTRDFQSVKREGELNDTEALDRIKNEAVLLTIEQIGRELEGFLREN
ncbi:MAG: hypothetical protein WBA17_10905 [Saprospiraceae bacterium]